MRERELSNQIISSSSHRGKSQIARSHLPKKALSIVAVVLHLRPFHRPFEALERETTAIKNNNKEQREKIRRSISERKSRRKMQLFNVLTSNTPALPRGLPATREANRPKTPCPRPLFYSYKSVVINASVCCFSVVLINLERENV